jgi:hypothetical protein
VHSDGCADTGHGGEEGAAVRHEGLRVYGALGSEHDRYSGNEELPVENAPERASDASQNDAAGKRVPAFGTERSPDP